MTRQEYDGAVDHVMVKYIQLVRSMLDQDDGDVTIAMHLRQLEARIAELQAPKTCDGCKSLYYCKSDDVYKCDSAVSDAVEYMYGKSVIQLPKEFYCSKYKPKDSI